MIPPRVMGDGGRIGHRGARSTSPASVVDVAASMQPLSMQPLETPVPGA
jgi:hypothetical protein